VFNKITNIREPNKADATKKEDNKTKFISFFISLFCDTLDFPNRNNILLSPYFKKYPIFAHVK
jgi:hypothetical protein